VVLQVSKSTYETKTQEIAKQLLAATRENRSFFAQMRDQMRWDDKLLAWAMSNPGLRVQLFRFIDCLPALRSKPEIARHLQEYLREMSQLNCQQRSKGCSTLPKPTRCRGKWQRQRWQQRLKP
jgi:RHH-type proline utilization regulon transcriptional repressor/proline dehydrogenase/delta 1-pyrroline-5-carboxylate dehydrogenase